MPKPLNNTLAKNVSVVLIRHISSHLTMSSALTKQFLASVLFANIALNHPDSLLMIITSS